MNGQLGRVEKCVLYVLYEYIYILVSGDDPVYNGKENKTFSI